MIGHSTVVIELAGRRILTDPWFGRRGNLAYRRLAPPSVGRHEVSPPELVLLSHNHWDHTDRRFFRALDDAVPILAPRRSRWLTRLKGARNVLGMRPYDARSFGALSVTAVPALHVAATIGFVLQAAGQTVYFAGDTYHRPFMRDIGARFAPDVALLPVTTYRIPMTMGERSAVRAVADLKARVVIPIHRGIEPRSPLLRTRQSAASFARRVGAAGLESEIVLLDEGESWRSPRSEESPADGAAGAPADSSPEGR